MEVTSSALLESCLCCAEVYSGRMYCCRRCPFAVLGRDFDAVYVVEDEATNHRHSELSGLKQLHWPWKRKWSL